MAATYQPAERPLEHLHDHRQELPRARARAGPVLRASIHPDGPCTVLVIDEPDGFVDAGDGAVRAAHARPDRPPSASSGWRPSTTWIELSTAVKPWLLRHLLERDGVDAVIYLDPDIRVFAPLDEIDAARARARRSSSPRTTGAAAARRPQPSEEDILIAGVYNLGFIARRRRRRSPSASRLVVRSGSSSDCLSTPSAASSSTSAGSTWRPGCDQIASCCATPATTSPTGTCHARLEATGDGYRVDGEPLRSSTSAASTRAAHELSKHQDRIELARPTRRCRGSATNTPRSCCADRASRRRAAGPTAGTRRRTGVRLTGVAGASTATRVEAARFSDSRLRPARRRRFARLPEEPAERRRRARRSTRYVEALWERAPDLSASSPTSRARARPASRAGCAASAATRPGSSPTLLPGAARADGAGVAGAHRRDVEPGRTAVEPGVNVAGYLSSELGVGEAARR